MAYVPNASDPTQPTEDKTVESAALEFRTIKPVLIRTLRFPAADAESYRGELPVAANRAGRFLAFDSVTGVPIPGPLLTDWTITQAQIAAVGTVAGSIASVNTVAGSIAAVNTVATNIADVNAIYTNLAEILLANDSAAAAATSASAAATSQTAAANSATAAAASALAAATAETAAETAASTAASQAILAQNAASAASSYVGGFRNRIINGDMRIDQRNAGASVTVNTASAFYAADRFRLSGVASSGVFTGQQVVDAPSGFSNSLKATVTTTDATLAGSDIYYAVQNIEGFNTADLAFGTASAASVTLSFWIKSSVTGTFGGALSNNGVTRSYPFTYAISAANTWEQKTVTIAGDTTGTWTTDNTAGIRVYFGLGIASGFAGTAGAWAGSQLLSATGAVNLMATSGATWQITGVQLEAGTVASPFERRDYGRELMMCQRYYETGGRAGWIGAATSAGSSVIGFVGYRVTKRAASAVITIPSYAAVGVSSAGVYSATTDGFEINGTTTTSGGTAYIISNSWSASSEL